MQLSDEQLDGTNIAYTLLACLGPLMAGMERAGALDEHTVRQVRGLLAKRRSALRSEESRGMLDEVLDSLDQLQPTRT